MAERTAKRTKVEDEEAARAHVVTPGDVIAAEAGFMRGHGTLQRDERLTAVVSGVVARVNKVVSVVPVRARHGGEIGDVVVGRITDVGQRRWKVDTQSRLDSILKLSSVNLPGGELRRKSVEDELSMRELFQEGDLISAEVQAVHQEDGCLSLHTRNQKYGKLGPGVFLAVPAALIKRSKNHFHMLPCGVAVVLGTNGYIWIGERFEYAGDSQPIGADLRERIARVYNVIVGLASQNISIFDTSIIYTYEDSEQYAPKDLLRPEVVAEATARARVVASAS